MKKNEAGKRVHVDSADRGELYQKWVKRTRGGGVDAEAALRGRRLNEDGQGFGRARNNSTSQGRSIGGKKERNAAHGKERDSRRKPKNELKNPHQIRKSRQRIKNKNAKIGTKSRRREEIERGGVGGIPRPSKLGRGSARRKSHRV